MAFARAVARITLPIALVAGVILSNVAPAAADTTPSQFTEIFGLAKTKIGDPWVHYAKGPNKFDCVGYVWYIFHEFDLQTRSVAIAESRPTTTGSSRVASCPRTTLRSVI